MKDVKGVAQVRLKYSKLIIGGILYLFLLVVLFFSLKPVYLMEKRFIENNTNSEECLQFIEENDADNGDTAVILSVIFLDVLLMIGLNKITKNVTPMSVFRRYVKRRLGILRRWYNENN